MQIYQTYEYGTDIECGMHVCNQWRGLEAPTKIEDWAVQTLVQLHLGRGGM